MSKLIKLSIPCLLLAGCVGMQPAELRATDPIMSIQSTKARDVIAQCITDEHKYLRPDRMSLNIYAEREEIELLIGALQAGKFRYYYSISIKSISDGSNITVKYAHKPYVPLSPEKLRQTIQKCSSSEL